MFRRVFYRRNGEGLWLSLISSFGLLGLACLDVRSQYTSYGVYKLLLEGYMTDILF